MLITYEWIFDRMANGRHFSKHDFIIVFFFQEMKLGLLRIPPEASEIFITGGDRITLGPKSFDQMTGLTLLRIDSTRTLVMEKQSFRNVTTPSLLIQIQNCDQLSIKTGAFESLQVGIVCVDQVHHCVAFLNYEGHRSKMLTIKPKITSEIIRLLITTMKLCHRFYYIHSGRHNGRFYGLFPSCFA